MGLVTYPSSSDDEADDSQDPAPAAKRVKRDNDPPSSRPKQETSLPALPESFRDLYSSTVRTTVEDDPTLHAGRQRVTPHVVGNWPAHVYLEWHPKPVDLRLLTRIIDAAGETRIATDPNSSSPRTTSSTTPPSEIHTLLHSPLSVPQPLHISLSRPLSIPSAQKDAFTAALRTAVTSISTRFPAAATAIRVRPRDVIWHPNEDRSRWFLVLRLRRPEQPNAVVLRELLDACNGVARRFQLPVLYAEGQEPRKEGVEGRKGRKKGEQRGAAKGAEGESTAAVTGDQVVDDDGQDHFHVSIAWSLHPPLPRQDQHEGTLGSSKSDSAVPPAGTPVALSDELLSAVRGMMMTFSPVKLRMGQDVTVIKD